MRKRNLVTLFLIFTAVSINAQSGVELANKMIAKVKTFKTLQFSFELQERYLGKMISERNNFKLNLSPFKAYFKQDFPVKGLEGLYKTGENDNKAKINPNAFPWITLNLDPQADLMMKNHHHPVFHAGYGYIAEVLDILIKKYQAKTDNLIAYKGTLKYNGEDVLVLDCNNPFYAVKKLTLTKAETPYDLGKRLYVNYLVILEENPDLKAFSEIPAGKTIRVPTDYASKMLIYLNKTQLYPVYVKISDSRGLFEEYKFINVIINPVFKADVFSVDNKEYNF
jgi:hypothetical protein